MKETKGVLYREWKSAGSKAAMLLVHGLGGHSGRWGHLGNFFAENRVSCYAVELEGFGETDSLKGHADSLNTYFSGIQALRDIISMENPGGKIFLLGESMGGLLAFSFAGRNEKSFDGVICLSPAFKSRIRFSAFEYAAVFFNYIFNPKKQFKLNFNSSMCTRDEGYREAMDSSHAEHRLATAKLLVNLAGAQIKAARFKDKIKTPVLFLLAGKDQMTDPAASEKIFDDLKLKDKTIFVYPEMYHALSIDTGREKVFEDIFNWVSGHIA
jgi:alpha-beta hydrolase superfamily lysophospholipase